MIIDTKKTVSSFLSNVFPFIVVLFGMYLSWVYVSVTTQYYNASYQVAMHQAQAIDRLAGAVKQN